MRSYSANLEKTIDKKEIARFKRLVKKSRWLSNLEKEELLGKRLPYLPSYLIEAAYDAVKEENDFFNSLKRKAPEVYDYLESMQAWLLRTNKSVENFPGFPHTCASDSLKKVFSQTVKKPGQQEKLNKDEPAPKPVETAPKPLTVEAPEAQIVHPGIEETPELPIESPDRRQEFLKVQPDRLSESPPEPPKDIWKDYRLHPLSKFITLVHPNTTFDEQKFLTLLAGSISLNADEKFKIIDSVPKLSQKQIDDLIKIFEEERINFNNLAQKHSHEILRLKSEHEAQWSSEVCARYFLPSSREKLNINEFFGGILRVENLFQRHLFRDALEEVEKLLGSAPGFVFYYEYYFQALKTMNRLQVETVKASLNKRFKDTPGDLYLILEKFFEFEEICRDDKRRFLEKIENFDAPGAYGYIRPYLMSKYHLYYGEGEDSIVTAEMYVNEAIGLVDETQTEELLFLLHHKIRIYTARKDFKSVLSLVNIIFKEDTPPYYRCLEIFGTFFDAAIYENDEVIKQTLENFIHWYAREHDMTGLLNAAAEKTAAGSQELWSKIQELQSIIKVLGFASETDASWERDMDRLIGEKQYRQAIAQIESRLQAHPEGQHYFNLRKKLFNIYRITEPHDAVYREFRKKYQEKPDFHNHYLYFLLLDSLPREYRYEKQAAAYSFKNKYYYLTVGYTSVFNAEHYGFTREEISKTTEKLMNIGLSCGISPPIFECYSEFYRWSSESMPGTSRYLNCGIFSLLFGMVFLGDFGRAIIATYRKKWYDIALAFFLVDIKWNPNNHHLYNCFSIALDESGTDAQPLVSVLSIVRAINLYNTGDGTLLTNKSSPFVNLLKSRGSLPSNAFYSSIKAVTADPHHTWNSFSGLLDASMKTGQNAVYLTAYYTGLDNECPQIKDIHHNKATEIISDYLDNPEPVSNFSYAVCLTRAIIDRKSYWIEERNLLNAEGAAFDVLHQCEKILETATLDDFFLSEHTHEEFLDLTSQDWYLLYRYTDKHFDGKYEVKLSALRRLETMYPMSRKKKDIKHVSRARTLKKFIAALNSGRVQSDIAATIVKAKPHVTREIEEYYHRVTIVQERINAEIEKMDSYSLQITQFVIDALGKLYNDLDNVSRVKLKSDISLLFKSKEASRAYIEKRFDDIFSIYKINTAAARFITKIERFLTEYVTLREQHDDLVKMELANIRREQLDTGVRLFNCVKRFHVLDGSDMFESFRKRIRHGWLIASLKDCFARHDLYMDAEEGNISSRMRKILDQVTDSTARSEIENLLVDLTQTFNHTAHKLDMDILLLKDERHPEGLLDYADYHFNLEQFIEQFLLEFDFKEEYLDLWITRCCKLLDAHTLSCFDNIKNYLEKMVHKPLGIRIKQLRKAVEKRKPAFIHIPFERDRILASLYDAESEFKKNIDIYKTWFDFYKSAVRDFTLPEIVEAAEKLVRDINLAKIEEKRIGKAHAVYSDELDRLYFKGENFLEMLELFKVLFQNVVYHAERVSKKQEGIGIDISATIEKSRKKETHICVEFSSSHGHGVDTRPLIKTISDGELRRSALLRRQGRGLASVQDILMKLKGAHGAIKTIRYDQKQKKFIVVFNIILKERGAPVQQTKEEAMQSIPLEQLVSEAGNAAGIKILIVEDQKAKYDSLRYYVQDILTDCHITHTFDVETTCRLLIKPGTAFDLILLDMTLPEDPSFDSGLKSLAGLSILKVMKLNGIEIPTVCVTQYSNWSAEAYQNTRVFIDNLDNYCFSEYKAFYKGAIRFSHTELTWRPKLKEIIYSLESTVSYYIEMGDLSRIIEIYQRELARSPTDIEVLIKLGEAYRISQQFTNAIEYFSRALEMADDHPDVLEGLAVTYAEIGDTAASEEYFRRFTAKHSQQAETLRGKILDAKLKTITRKKQELYQGEMMATLGEMAANMAHEFNSPLQALKLIAQKTSRYQGDMSPGEIRECLSRIDAVVDSMAGQVRHVKALARHDRVKTEKVGINLIIKRAFLFFKEQLKLRSIQVRYDLEDDLPAIDANPSRLEQVFINLIQNSREALETVTGRKKEIIVRTCLLRGETNALLIHFEDNGTGIKQENQSKVFEPFFTTKDIGKGMGLGLSIAKETIQEIGGSIRLHSESSLGVTVIIEIPIKQEKQEVKHEKTETSNTGDRR